jgi:predicted AlkP superfamily pyrophosphatase or phosphodiesterase
MHLSSMRRQGRLTQETSRDGLFPKSWLLLVLTALVPFVLLPARATAQVSQVEYVVVIGVDGLSPDGVRKAKVPNLNRLMKEGAHTLHARGVMPTVSSPNWASMIMGAGPEQHGITSNEWEPGKAAIKPTETGPEGIFPTIFGVLRAQQPAVKIACFHDWDGFGRLVERRACNVIEDSAGPVQATEHAVAYLVKERPRLTFIHLDHVDDAGHNHGHGTPEYYAAVAEADRLTGLVLRGLEDAGLADHSIVLITSDHGGIGKKHGGATMAEIEIPWIIHGRGVAAGKELTTPVNTYDTAATIAYIFGLKTPRSWIGRPVTEAFAH